MRLSAERTEEAVGVLARAFVTNPLHVVVFGHDAVRANEAFFRIGLSAMAGKKLVAVDGGRVLGVVHWVESPNCQFSWGQKLGKSFVMVSSFGLRSTVKVAGWLSVWSKHDPREPHVHFGPIAVDPNSQRRGIGHQLMRQFCDHLDESASVGYLETDRPENVRFYRQFGFDVTHTTPIHGVVNYLMRRERKKECR